MDIKIKTLTTDAFQINKTGIANVFISAFNAPPWNENWNPEAAIETLEWIVEHGGYGLYAECNAKIVGFILGQGPRPWLMKDGMSKTFNLREICIHPDFQGHKIGRLLLETLEKELKLQGASVIELETHKTLTPFFEKSMGAEEPEDLRLMLKVIN